MTALKTAEAERFLKAPENRERVILFYGPDPGGIADRASVLAKRLVGDDPLAIIRIDSDELSADPGRIADEAFGASLFSGRRVIRGRAVPMKQDSARDDGIDYADNEPTAMTVISISHGPVP